MFYSELWVSNIKWNEVILCVVLLGHCDNILEGHNDNIIKQIKFGSYVNGWILMSKLII